MREFRRSMMGSGRLMFNRVVRLLGSAQFEISDVVNSQTPALNPPLARRAL